MGLAIMIVGLAVFLGAHVFTSMRERRAAVIARLGEGPYKGVYALVSLIGIALIGYGFARYRAAGMIELWYPPRWTRHVNNLLLWPAFICIVAAYIPGDIKRVLKHPMLVGVKLWAFGHLLANGDLGSIILFGSFLAWAVYDRITLKRRSRSRARRISGWRSRATSLRSWSARCLFGARLLVPPIRHRRTGVREGRLMSAQDEIKRLTAPDIRARKGGEPIVCLTSYHAHTARLVDAIAT